jgi:chitin disaccharide deacetylase
LRLLYKDLSQFSVLEAALEVKPAFLYDPMREIETYRTILEASQLGTATCYGAIVDAMAGRYGLFLEKVPGLELYQVGDFATWRRVSAWLAAMHARFAGMTGRVARAAPLLRYDGDFYRLWAGRARSSLDRAGLRLSRDACRGMEQLFENYDRVIEQLVALPMTFIHGEFYASNVLVQEEGKICASARSTGRWRLWDLASSTLRPSPRAGGQRTKGRRWPWPTTPRWYPARIGRRRRMRSLRRLTTAGCTWPCNGWAGLRVGRRPPSTPRTGWVRRWAWLRSWDWREPPARHHAGEYAGGCNDRVGPTLNADKRYLIVNADDFGRSPGVNRGVIEAHERGIVTSASLMVRWPAAAEAAAYAREHQGLALGLHFDLGEWNYREGTWLPAYEVAPADDVKAVMEEAARQLAAFRQLAGGDPTHLDSHQHVHLREPVRSVLIELAAELAVPLRHYDPRIRYNGDFYGQTGEGRLLPQAISVEAFIDILAALPSGATELACHPGLDDELQSTYRSERAQELRVLCDPRVPAALAAEEIELCSFGSDALQRLDPTS